MFPAVEFFARSCRNASLLTIPSISVDRFLMVAYPIKHRQWTNRKVIAIWLSCIWLISSSYALKRFISGVKQNYEDLVHGGLVAVLFSLAGISYPSIYIPLKRQSRRIIEQNNSSRNHVEEVATVVERKEISANDHYHCQYCSFFFYSRMDFFEQDILATSPCWRT